MGNSGSIPADYSQPAWGITVMLIVLTTIALVSRIISRSMQNVRYSVDDTFIYLAYFLNLGQLIVGLLEISHGAVSIPRLAKSTTLNTYFLKNVTIALGILYSLAILAVKISVLSLYHRIFTITNWKFRLGWWINLLFLFPCWAIVVFTIIGIQVAPHKKNLGYDNLSHVASPIVGALNALSDLMVLVLPIGMVAKLNLPKRDKVAIISLFSLGSVATSISIMRAARFHIKNTNHWNPAYAFYNDMVMTMVESSTGLICACLMVIKPLIRKIRELTLSRVSEIFKLLSFRSKNGNKTSGSVSLHSENDPRIPNQEINRSDEYEVGLEPMHLDKTKQSMIGQNIYPSEDQELNMVEGPFKHINGCII